MADLVIDDKDPLEDFQAIAGRVVALFMDGSIKINNCRLSIDRVSAYIFLDETGCI